MHNYLGNVSDGRSDGRSVNAIKRRAHVKHGKWKWLNMRLGNDFGGHQDGG